MSGKIPTAALMKIASVGGVFVIGNALLMKYLMQKRFLQSPYFLQVDEVVRKHNGLMEFMGEPIQYGMVDLGDNQSNYAGTEEAKFEVLLKGVNHEGMLNFTSVRRNPEGDSSSNNSNGSKYSGWSIKELEIKVKDKPGQKLILYQDFEPWRGSKAA